MKEKIDRSWLVCAGCFLLLFCTMGIGINGYSVFHPYIMQKLQLTNVQGSVLINIRNAFCMLAMGLAEKYTKTLKFRKGCACAALLAALSFLIYACASHYLCLCAGSAVAGLAYGFGGLMPVSMLIHGWFPEKEGTALGFSSLGSSMAAIFLPVPLTQLIEMTGIMSACLCCAVVVSICAAIIFFTVEEPEKNHRIPKNRMETCSFSGRMLISRKEYSMLILLCIFVGYSSNVAYNHYSVYFFTEGIQGERMSVLLMILGISMAFGKITVGRAVDRIGLRKSNLVFSVIMAAGIMAACLSKKFPILCLSMILVGICLPLHVLFPSFLSQIVSYRKEYAGILKEFQIYRMLGAVLMGWIPGTLADWSGHYEGTYLFMIGFTIASMMILEKIYKSEFPG